MCPGCNAQRCKAIHSHPTKSHVEKQVSTSSEKYDFMWGQSIAVPSSLINTFHAGEGAKMKLEVKVTRNLFLFGQQNPTYIGPHTDCGWPHGHSAQAAAPCQWSKMSSFSCRSGEWRLPVAPSSGLQPVPLAQSPLGAQHPCKKWVLSWWGFAPALELARCKIEDYKR